LFICFAPKNNPKIAIAVIVENSGFGGVWAAPISGLLIEKYFNDSIATNRKWHEERILNYNMQLVQQEVQDGND
jgi:penicillin-binding protein 2